MYQADEGITGLQKNKFESSISELKKKTFVTAADIESYGDSGVTKEYVLAHRRSLEDPEGFWAEVGHELVWTKPWDRVLDNTNPPFTKWQVYAVI
ncbi:Acetyl-coenzyme A synthetase [Papilio xuthus]|uniref:Acetyl-coenzyme A synthetase n=1 Tax=Papilio xuthus TaxID=66420 RepID=A0A194QEU7_PAPXU|nr:Acetyl-coenzyme A synthetase [Papilio xuthus]